MADRYLAATGGSDSNPGTISQPWATMAASLPKLAAGDTLYCRVGTHGEINITSTVNAGTSWANAITVQAYPGEVAQLPRIRLAHTSVAYWIFADLLLDGTDTQANGLSVQTGVDFVRLATSELRNYTGSAVVIDSTSNGQCEILGNYIHDVAGNGILVRAANNLVQGNTIAGGGVETHGIDNFLTASTAVSNNIYRGNYIYGIGTSTADTGIRIATGTGNQVVYNVIAEGTGDGIEIGLDSLNTSIYNNTIYSNVGNGIEILSTSDGGNILRNNILYQNGATIVDGRGDATTSHNLTTDPSFVNAAAGNFELQSGSAARNAGTVISGLTIDFLGHAVPQGSAPDIGAFEFEEAPVTDLLPDPVPMMLFPVDPFVGINLEAIQPDPTPLTLSLPAPTVAGVLTLTPSPVACMLALPAPLLLGMFAPGFDFPYRSNIAIRHVRDLVQIRR